MPTTPSSIAAVGDGGPSLAPAGVVEERGTSGADDLRCAACGHEEHGAARDVIARMRRHLNSCGWSASQFTEKATA
jgi:hypothetical protein